MRSKEDKVLEPFFNTPKHWHFEELCRATPISKPQLSYWLKKYEKEGLIKRVKPRGKMPYYAALEENPEYQNIKRLYALKFLTESGLFNHLAALKKAKVVILFGSFSRYDWYGNSDIDILIEFNGSLLTLIEIEMKLKERLRKKVDLLTYNGINHLLKERILKEEIKII